MGWDGWDDLGVEMERRWPWAIPLDDPMSLDNVVFWMNVGQSLVLAGQGSDPVMEVRLSDDAGQTWTDWEDAEIGNAAIGGTGMYRTLPEFRALGMYDFPGWRGQRPMGDPSAMQDWRQQRPQLMNYLNPGSMAPNGQFPVNLQGMHGVGVATPGGGMTGAPLQPQMVGSSMNVQGMIQPTSPYGLPTY
jgi:hypothetical protein